MAAATVGGGGASEPNVHTNALFDIDVQRFVVYWTAQHTLERNDPPMAKSTVEGHVQWLRRYRLEHPAGAALTSLRELVADLPLFIRYLDGRVDKSSGTRARDADSFLACLKYVWSPYDNLNPPKELVLIRTTRSQLQRQYEIDLKSRSSREALDAAGKWLGWPEVVACASAVVAEWEHLERAYRREQRGVDVAFDPSESAREEDSLQRRSAQAAQAALLVQTYTAVCPGRGGEYWSLQWASSPSEMPSAARPNLLVVCPVNGALLRLGQHKTSKSRGVEEVPLPSEHFDKVVAAVLAHRSTLLQGKGHSYVFCRPSDGNPFASSGRWAQYLQATWARGWRATPRQITTGLDSEGGCGREPPKISVNSLRKAFVTAVHGDESVTATQKQSVARCMRHTEAMATSSYNCATNRDRVLLGLGVAAQWRSVGATTGVREATESDSESDAGQAEGDDSHDDDSHDDEAPAAVDDDDNDGNDDDDNLHALDKVVAMRRRAGEVEWLCRWEEQGASETWEPEYNVPSWAVRQWFERAAAVRKTQAKVKAVSLGGANPKRQRASVTSPSARTTLQPR